MNRFLNNAIVRLSFCYPLHGSLCPVFVNVNEILEKTSSVDVTTKHEHALLESGSVLTNGPSDSSVLVEYAHANNARVLSNN